MDFRWHDWGGGGGRRCKVHFKTKTLLAKKKNNALTFVLTNELSLRLSLSRQSEPPSSSSHRTSAAEASPRHGGSEAPSLCFAAKSESIRAKHSLTLTSFLFPKTILISFFLCCEGSHFICNSLLFYTVRGEGGRTGEGGEQKKTNKNSLAPLCGARARALSGWAVARQPAPRGGGSAASRRRAARGTWRLPTAQRERAGVGEEENKRV